MNTPPYARLLAGLGILLLRRKEGRTFHVPGAPPEWFRSFVAAPIAPDAPIEPGKIFPFVDLFLEDAETFWAERHESELRSNYWAEMTPDGATLHFEAIARTQDGTDYLIIRCLAASAEQIQNVFQKGRDLSLTHERLVSEIGKKEILLHCVVHDLSGPLQGLTGALEIARKTVQTAEAKKFIELGLLSAKQQGNLIDDLLDTFRAEVSSMAATPTDRASAPDVIACAVGVMAMLQPAFAVRGVKGEVLTAADSASIPVVADKSRLERVFYNLLQNAMRHSPKGGSVTISTREENGFVHVAIEDEGPGVPPDVVPQLFQKFVRAGKSGGKAGLGLYFCRITVEGWGGAIGCEPRAGGGTSFWFRLKRI